MGQLFGTDGVRGVANVDLTPELVFRLGRAAVHVLATHGSTRFLLGRDTRISGPMLEAALTAAVCSAGGTVLSGDILPTPAVAYLTRHLAASAGVVISASHNPIEDNGIKFFAKDGYKLPDAVEDAIEAVLDRHDLQRGADVGFAHDGDADRVVAVDETGRIIDGDAIMGVCAIHLHAHGKLARGTVVATVMSNLGLEVALRGAGITLERTKVGDRYVLERMRELGATLGGEQSGHVIFLDQATTGDGALTAVQVVNVMLETGKRLSELAAPIERFPQILLNVTVADRGTLAGHPAIGAAVADAERTLGPRGRVLVRPSGTEPLVRVMVEAQDQSEAESLAGRLADLIARELRGRRA